MSSSTRAWPCSPFFSSLHFQTYSSKLALLGDPGECDGVQISAPGPGSQKGQVDAVHSASGFFDARGVLGSPGDRRDLPPAEVWISLS